MKADTSHLVPSLAVALCGALWGIFWLPLRWLDTQGVGGAWVSVVFGATCLLVPLPWLLKTGRWTNGESELKTGLLLGTGFSLYTVSLVLTDVINAILLFYLSPVWSTLLSWALQGHRLSLPRVIALGLGFLGMALVLGGEGRIPVPHTSGDWLALASGFLWSVGTMRSFAKPSDGIALPVFCFALGGFVSSLAIAMFAHTSALPLAELSGVPSTLHWIVILALIIFVPPNFLVLWAAQRIDPGRVGILLMTEVLVGAISAALLSGEDFGLWKAAGASLIVLAGLTEVFNRAPQATR